MVYVKHLRAPGTSFILLAGVDVVVLLTSNASKKECLLLPRSYRQNKHSILWCFLDHRDLFTGGHNTQLVQSEWTMDFFLDHSNKNSPVFFEQCLKLIWGLAWLQLFCFNNRTQPEDAIVKGDGQVVKISSERNQSSNNIMSFWIKPYLKTICHFRSMCLFFEFFINCNQRILTNTGSPNSISTKNINIEVKHPKSNHSLFNKKAFY